MIPNPHFSLHIDCSAAHLVHLFRNSFYVSDSHDSSKQPHARKAKPRLFLPASYARPQTHLQGSRSSARTGLGSPNHMSWCCPALFQRHLVVVRASRSCVSKQRNGVRKSSARDGIWKWTSRCKNPTCCECERIESTVLSCPVLSSRDL
jgi:hypothetical protein